MKNKPYAKIILLLISCFMFLSSCTRAEAASIDSGDTFVVVESTINWNVVYCRKTKVMYVVSKGYDNKGDFTLLVNPDGTPMIWDSF